MEHKRAEITSMRRLEVFFCHEEQKAFKRMRH